MRVLTFQLQFHDLIRGGQKTSTIRDNARCKPGDELSLRRWQGRPYTTLQELLIPNQICSAVSKVAMEIRQCGAFVFSLTHEESGTVVILADGRQVEDGACHIARREGFASFAAMKDWFIKNKKITADNPYKGYQIEWNYLGVSS